MPYLVSFAQINQDLIISIKDRLPDLLLGDYYFGGLGNLDYKNDFIFNSVALTFSLREQNLSKCFNYFSTWPRGRVMLHLKNGPWTFADRSFHIFCV